MDILKVSNLTKVYGKGAQATCALDDVSFSIPEGQFVAIVGASGSGKSTLLHLIGGVDRPTSGTVELNGANIYARTDEQLAVFRRREVGLVYQFYNLVPILNVIENITLPVALDGRGVNEERLASLMRTLGLEGYGNRLPNQLSGGQQQRVAIARALMTDPELLLLDEITSALDPMLVGEVLNMVAELKAQGTTILMATHEMSFAHEAADRIVLLRHGVIAENGTPAEVMDESQDPETIEFFSHFRH